MESRSNRSWAREEFGGSELGDERRTARLVAMATEMADKPGGRVSDVFRRASDRQGAYDFLESHHVAAPAILDAAIAACVERSTEYPFVFVPLDGTSLNLTDHARSKDFGSVGSRARCGRGLKVIDGIAISPTGVPLGLAAMQWWARGDPVKRDRKMRSTMEKETQHWLDAVTTVATSMERAKRTKVWFQIDREGDAQRLLEKHVSSGHWFTVRSQADRKLHTLGDALRPSKRNPEKRRRFLRAYLGRRKPIAFDLLEVPARGGNPARLACVAIRTASVLLHLHDRRVSEHRTMRVNVVWVREHGRGPTRTSRSGQTRSLRLDWLLLTNHPVSEVDDAKMVVFGYTQRWRIEDFHRAWKSGICNVEDTQLHAREHVIKWATVLAAVAIRAERLKHLSRESPRTPATTEFSSVELDALIILKRRYGKRTENISDNVPDLATATRWIAELGGYTGKSSGGPPGSVTISRGLEQLHVAAEVLAAIASRKKKR